MIETMAVKALIGVALVSGLAAVSFSVGKTYQNGKHAEEALEYERKVSKLTSERDNALRDLQALTTKLKEVEDAAKKKLEEADADAEQTRKELTAAKVTLSSKLSAINARALQRDAADTSKRPRCRGPVLSPGLMQDINAAIEVTK